MFKEPLNPDLGQRLNAIDAAILAHDLLLSVAFIDNELPVGAKDGTNKLFILAHAPDPVDSLQLFWNGLNLGSDADFCLAGSILTLAIPLAEADKLRAFYRYFHKI